MVVHLQNRSKRPVYFDDLLLTIRPGLDPVSVEAEQPHSSASTGDFAAQTPVDTATVYHDYSYRRCGNTGIDGGGAIVDNYFNFLPAVTVTAPAPKYGYSDGNIVVDAGSTPGGTTGGSNNGGSGGQTGSSLKQTAKTKAIRMSYCNGINSIWSWSYQNNDMNKTVEMAGFELVDGTFLSIPWNGNLPEKSFFDLNATWPDNTGVYEYSFQKSLTSILPI